jgi:hypothetical protein
MRLSSVQAALGSALLLLADQQCLASNAHRRAHQQLEQKRSSHGHGHAHNHQQSRVLKPWERDEEELVGMSKQQPRAPARCQFPSDPDLIAVTPGALNGGWAMSPDQECRTGSWCPIACKAGKVMAQWEPNSSYTYPASMVSLLFCTWRAPP